MIQKILQWDEEFFLFLNAQQVDWLDPVMNTLTGRYFWFPFYAFLLVVLIWTYKKESLWIIVGLLLVVVLADQFTTAFMKPFFGRLRPCHDPRWADIILNYAGCGGLYGFASSHAANTFALAGYLNLSASKKIKSFSWLYLWAAVISYTRVYLGVHYSLDIVIGALVGLIAAWIIWLSIEKAKQYSSRTIKK